MFSSTQAIQFWNNGAEGFLLLSRQQNSFYRRRIELVERLIARYTSPCSCLDIGCAQGELVLRLHQLGYRSYGTDISEQMITAAIRNTNGILPEAASRFRLTQGSTPPFINSFDLVSVIGVLPYIGDHHNYLKYLQGLLNKDGVLIITCTSPFSMYNFGQIVKHLCSFPYNKNWADRLVSFCHTGLRSGGFVEGGWRKQTRSMHALKKLLINSGFDILDSISLYNISSLDGHPLQRGKTAKWISHRLGWTQLVVARKHG